MLTIIDQNVLEDLFKLAASADQGELKRIRANTRSYDLPRRVVEDVLVIVEQERKKRYENRKDDFWG